MDFTKARLLKHDFPVHGREQIRCGEEKRYGNSKTTGKECSEVLVFLGKSGRKTVQIVKNYGGSKILRNRAPYYFS